MWGEKLKLCFSFKIPKFENLIGQLRITFIGMSFEKRFVFKYVFKIINVVFWPPNFFAHQRKNGRVIISRDICVTSIDCFYVRVSKWRNIGIYFVQNCYICHKNQKEFFLKNVVIKKIE